MLRKPGGRHRRCVPPGNQTGDPKRSAIWWRPHEPRCPLVPQAPARRLALAATRRTAREGRLVSAPARRHIEDIPDRPDRVDVAEVFASLAGREHQLGRPVHREVTPTAPQTRRAERPRLCLHSSGMLVMQGIGAATADAHLSAHLAVGRGGRGFPRCDLGVGAAPAAARTRAPPQAYATFQPNPVRMRRRRGIAQTGRLCIRPKASPELWTTRADCARILHARSKMDPDMQEGPGCSLTSVDTPADIGPDEPARAGRMMRFACAARTR